jgi:16S rRNA processing protein RimM
MGDELILVGRIARPHGIRGCVIVNPESDFVDQRFVVGQVLHLEMAGRSEQRTIESVRFHLGRPIVAFEGVETIEDAQGLTGAELRMPEAELPPLPGNTFYRHDLVGCEVRDKDGQVVGRVTGVEGPMERSRLVVAGQKGELQVPMVEPIWVSIDPASRVIVIDPPEGLLDLP